MVKFNLTTECRILSIYTGFNVEQRQAAADPQAKPLDLGCKYVAIVYNHHLK